MCILSQFLKKKRDENLVRPRFKSNSFLSPKILQEFRLFHVAIFISTGNRGSSKWVQSHQNLADKTQQGNQIFKGFFFPPWKEWLHCPRTTWFSQVQFIYKQTLHAASVDKQLTDDCEEGLQVRTRRLAKDQMLPWFLPDANQAPPGRSLIVWYVFKNSYYLNLKC